MKPVALVAIVMASAVATLTAQGVFRSRTDVVAIEVAVSDGRKPVVHLTKNDFELRDNGAIQSIADFSREELPLDLALTIDLSGSMTPVKLRSVERAVARVGADLRAADRARVVTFTSTATEQRALLPPPLAMTLPPTQPSAGTAIVDALLLALVTAPQHDRRQLGLFMTDGDDTSSVFDIPTALETARFANAQISFLIVRDRDELKNEAMLKLFRGVADTTGGQIIQLKSDDDLSAAFLDAIDTFRTGYVLRYTPSNIATKGWHDVTVAVKNTKYTVRARRGYWALPPGLSTGSLSVR
jgi:VWFA-related protein